ncbi:MAG: L-aspartate oxidase [Neisseria sp.]|nr:L-aspartate oxidase [Neisseria sp.]
MNNQVCDADVIVIGSGIAALHLVRSLGGRQRVCLLTKTTLRESNSYRAQGGVAAVVADNADSAQTHIADTLRAGDYHHRAAAVETLVEIGAQEVRRLIAQGFAVDRDAQGLPALGLEGAHTYPRVLHAGGDATGERLIEFSLANLPENLSIHEHHTVFELVMAQGRCVGVRSLHQDGTAHTFYAPRVVLASGGVGQLYQYTTAAPTVCGDGLALAYLAGAKLADMEFVQFHPTLLYARQQVCGLLSEAIRGEGGVLVNQRGERIMQGVHPLADLAPRHITAHRIFTCRAQGDEVFLDVRAVPDFARHFPTAAALCAAHGVDVAQGLLPVVPGCHFLMGGVMSDLHGQTSVPGLYAIGEVAHTGVHGANRLASNSLLEGLAFARLLAEHMASAPVPPAITDVPRLPKLRLPETLAREPLQKLMMSAAGIIRNLADLRQAAEKLPDPHDVADRDLSDCSHEEIEQYLMNVTASLIVQAALRRTESRGAHMLTDFPAADPIWAERYLVWQRPHLTMETMKETS